MTSSYLVRRARARRRKQPDRTSGILLIISALGSSILVTFAALAIGGACYYNSVVSGIEPPEQLIVGRDGGARIYDRNGTLLYQYFDERYGMGDRIDLEHVSPWIRHATIAAEDASFYSNSGINVRGIARAAVENLKPGAGLFDGSGGSSITQQLVKNLYFSPEERAQRSVVRKAREAAIAVHLTREYEKDQILEWYLQEISYGGVLIGIEAASQGYFGVAASDLTIAQAAFLAGLPQSPYEYNPFEHFEAATARQHDVLDLMVKQGHLSAELAAWAKLDVIVLRPAERPFLAPHFVQFVGDEISRQLGDDALYRAGLEIHTTLDLGLQTSANLYLEQHLQTYEKTSGGRNGSVVIMHPPSGQILAMVGSRDYFRDDVDGRVNNALGLNSPGSTLKPFTYLTAFQQGWGPDWPVIDTAIAYKEVTGETFTPRNPDGRMRGVMPVKTALGNSFNIPAFKTILWVGVENVVGTAKAMGLTTLDGDLGPALTLGGSDVKLLDMVYAYGTLANSGAMAGQATMAELPPGNRELDPVSVLRVTNRSGAVVWDNTQPQFRTAVEPEYAYMISDILSTDENRQITYGRGSNLNIPGRRVAVKTETSEPFAGNKLIGDTWTIGYTPDIVVGVWVGNSDNTPMVNIFSTTIAGRTWHDVMVAALDGTPVREFLRPAGVVEATLCVPSGRAVTPGEYCRTAKGMFAAAAIDRIGETWWGGQQLISTSAVKAGAIPSGVDGWKRTLAQEYLRYFARPVPAAAPTPQPGTPPGTTPTLPDAVPTTPEPAPTIPSATTQ